MLHNVMCTPQWGVLRAQTPDLLRGAFREQGKWRNRHRPLTAYRLYRSVVCKSGVEGPKVGVRWCRTSNAAESFIPSAVASDRLSQGNLASGSPLQVRSWASNVSTPLLDVRSKQEFLDRHIADAANIPVDELAARFYELPPKYFDDPLRLFGSPQELQEAQKLLLEGGWQVDQEMLDSTAEATWRNQQVVSGPSSARVWKPNEFLEEVFPRLLPALQVESPASERSHRKVAIDVGCGSGRDAVFLALALGPSWEIVAIDNHTKALQRAAELAEREGVHITCIDTNLRKKGLGDLRADLVHGSRFLCRELFPEIRDTVLNPGGVFVWSHFLEGEHLAPPYKPSRQLMHGELEQTFIQDAGFFPIHDEEGIMNTRSEDVPSAFFAAQKPRQ
mmetsp:Transcript_21537/g.47254  ORF Transcript_21537/g.47254 Transcript_21537/m.47254 type:complete len:390 (-) Transcript_21537:108-1277(-)